MASITIANFRYGLDSRRSELTSQPGTLLSIENAHITQGGEIEKRKALVRGAYPVVIATTTSTWNLSADEGGGYYDFAQVAGVLDITSAMVGKWMVFANGDHYLILSKIGADYSNLYVKGTVAHAPVSGGETVSIVDAVFGLQATDTGLMVFGSDTPSGTLPYGQVFQKLVNPIDASWKMLEVVCSRNFGGKAWVVAKFFDPASPGPSGTLVNASYVFYDGEAIGAWYEGYVIAASGSRSFLMRMYALLDGDAVTRSMPPTYAFSGYLVKGYTYRIAVYQAGDDFTNVGAASNATNVVFTATGEIPAVWTQGSSIQTVLDIGTMYTIDSYSVGDDFTNVGASSNAVGVTFIATGAVPTTWIFGSVLSSKKGLAGFHVSDYIDGASFRVNSDYGISFSMVAATLSGTTGLSAVPIVSPVTATPGYGATSQFKVTGGTGGIAGIQRLAIFTAAAPATAVDILDTVGGTVPVMMRAASGDPIADMLQFAQDIVAGINSYSSGYTAQLDSNQISLYAPDSAGAAANNTVLKCIAIGDLCVDNTAFQLVGTAGNSVTDVRIHGSGVNLLSGTVNFPATLDGHRTLLENWHYLVAASIVANSGTTGYTAFAYVAVDKTSVPYQYQPNVVVSKLTRRSDDSLAATLDVTESTGDAVIGGTLGNDIFSSGLKIVIPDYTVSGIKAWFSGSTTIAVPVQVSGGVPSYGYTVTVDSSGVVIESNRTNQRVTYTPNAIDGFINIKITAVPVDGVSRDGYGLTGILKVTVIVHDSSPSPGTYKTAVGNVLLA